MGYTQTKLACFPAFLLQKQEALFFFEHNERYSYFIHQQLALTKTGNVVCRTSMGIHTSATPALQNCKHTKLVNPSKLLRHVSNLDNAHFIIGKIYPINGESEKPAVAGN